MNSKILLNIIFLTVIASLLGSVLVLPIDSATAADDQSYKDYSRSFLNRFSRRVTGSEIELGTVPTPAVLVAKTVGFFFISIGGIVFMMIVIYGGIVWMTAGGNEERARKARKVLTGGLIGLAILFGGYAIVWTIWQLVKRAIT